MLVRYKYYDGFCTEVISRTGEDGEPEIEVIVHHLNADGEIQEEMQPVAEEEVPEEIPEPMSAKMAAPALPQPGPRRADMHAKKGPSRFAKAAIRSMWTFIFPSIGFGITAIVDNYTSLPVPWWSALVIGSIAYGAKKFWFPDTTF